jgi:hypothetical protein
VLLPMVLVRVALAWWLVQRKEHHVELVWLTFTLKLCNQQYPCLS